MAEKIEDLETRAKKSQYFISKKIGKAISDYKMLEEGDKVVVAVSGGKDSIALLKMLKFRQSFVPISFKIMACMLTWGIHVSTRSFWQNSSRRRK